MKQIKLLTLAMLVTLSWNLQAQDNPMKPFENLTGKWSGSGWSRTPDGKTLNFNQTEDIYTKLDGQLFVVNGLGKDATTDEKVFEAFGILSYSAQQQKYIFDAYTNEGQHTLANVDITDDGFDWWFEIPNGGKIKYSIKHTATSWVEDGHFSPDGKQWHQFFHMELTKSKS